MLKKEEERGNGEGEVLLEKEEEERGVGEGDALL